MKRGKRAWLFLKQLKRKFKADTLFSFKLVHVPYNSEIPEWGIEIF